MNNIRRNLTIIIGFIVILGVAIQITRLNGLIEKKENEKIIVDLQGEKIDKSLLSKAVKEEYIIIYDDEYIEFENTKNNITKTLDYMKINYTVKTISYANNQSNIYSKYDNIILVLEDLDKVKNVDNLMGAVYKGVNLFFPNRLAPTATFNNIYKILGIIEYGEFIENHGIALLDNVMIKGKGLTIEDENYIINSSVSIQLDSSAKKYAVSNEEINLLWSNNYGTGEIFYFNGTMLNEKVNRGLIAGIISLMGDDVIYPIINAKINYIDDFPSPSPIGNNEMITKEYGRDIEQFYREIWWPDLLRTAKLTNSKFTAVAIGTYSNEVENLEDDDIVLSLDDFNYYINEIFASGGEIGLHGYNHQPLIINEAKDKDLGYLAWASEEVIKEGLSDMTYFMKNRMKAYSLATYVPPSNIIDEAGINILREVNPDFKILASLYNVGENKDSYEQELEISQNGIINLPRLIAGYSYTDEMKWQIINGVSSVGYFSHFGHPDDILDNDRSGGSDWSELYKEYNSMQRDVYNNYPWLIGKTASEGANDLIKYEKTETYYEKTDEFLNIYCDNFLGEISFILRSEKEIKDTISCDITKIDEGVYLVIAKEAISTIKFKG